jgi:hypothetical protein
MDLGFALLKATIRKPMPAQTVIGQKTNSRYIRFGIGMMTVQFRYGSFRGILKNGILISQVKRNIRIAGSMYCNLNVSASKEKRKLKWVTVFCCQFARLKPSSHHTALTLPRSQLQPKTAPLYMELEKEM